MGSGRAQDRRGHRRFASVAKRLSRESAALLKSDSVARAKLGRTPTPATMAAAMASVASWADDVKRDTNTGSWHFLDLAGSDQQAQLAARCPGGNCVTEKIRVMTANLKAHRGFPRGTRVFTPTEELKFIIHLMGDLHQPLHAATNADAGGNCLTTDGFGTTELHAAWDGGMIRRILLKGTNEADLERALDTRFASPVSGSDRSYGSERHGAGIAHRRLPESLRSPDGGHICHWGRHPVCSARSRY